MNKYHATKVIDNGITFASKGEHRRYRELLLMVKAKEIRDLTLQPKFPIILEGTKICTVIGDFEYIEGNQWVIEDYKGFDTPLSRLKRKLVKAFYPTLEWRVIK